jgi:hypothetical protein
LPYSTLLLAAVPLAWLLPNHYFPWLSAFNEGLALALTLGAALLCAANPVRLPAAWLAALALAVASVLLQWAGGRILFGGDAVMVLLYLGALACALALGATLPGTVCGRYPALELLALGTLFCAIASVGVALVQWTDALNLGSWGADMEAAGRPYGNVAQPNQFCTLSFLGLCALGLLNQGRRVQGFSFWLAALFLLGGVAMSDSRTGWLQLGALVVLVAGLGRRTGLRMPVRTAATLAAVLAVVAWNWQDINEALLISSGRALAEKADAGLRRLHWSSMVDAIGREPWWGYGWQQAGLAQGRVAADHPFVGEYIEHSHNLVLDLLVWAGIPVGGALAALLLWWLMSRLARVGDPVAAWLLAGIVGLAIHSMLEYPLEYAYFLLPLGVAVGAVDALHPQAVRPRLPGPLLRGLAAALGGLLVWVGIEYLQAEQSFRMLRLESAHIGVDRITSQAPHLTLLTQLEAYQRFARTEARPGMSAADVEDMGRVVDRFAYPPALFRYALALGLHHRPAEARLVLVRLCKIHKVERCDEGRVAWRSLQQRYPELAAIDMP